jgi:hypothetical protein
MGVKEWICVWMIIMPGSMQGQSSSLRSLLAADAFADQRTALGAAAYPVVSAWLDGAAIAMSGDHFFNAGLPYHELSLALPAKGNGWGLLASRSGTEFLNESRFDLSWSKAVSAGMCLGLRLGYGAVSARGYGNQGSPAAGLGFGWRVTDRFTWLCQVDNIHALFGDGGPQGYVVRSGIGYRFSEFCMGMAEVQAREGYGQSFSLALEYRPVSVMGFRIGYSRDMFMATACFAQGAFGLYVSSSWHLALGFSHGLAIAYSVRRKS